MANRSFSSWGQLEAYLRPIINKALNDKVAPQVKDEIKTAVSEKIYNSGTPVSYQRRGGNAYGGMSNSEGTGSLSDTQEMNHQVNNMELIVTDEADSKMPWDRDLTEALVHGYGSKNEWYNEGRDFLQTAVDNMKQSKSHVESLKDGLRDNGIEVL